MTNLERAVKDLQDNLVAISEIERRQSELLKVHSERLVLIEAETAEYRLRTDQNLAEITDKLNGLIGYVSDQRRPSPPRSN
jgi:predicted  nucleic acid-binding Zn-ribbon protein